jgi:hypothetical protein
MPRSAAKAKHVSAASPQKKLHLNSCDGKAVLRFQSQEHLEKAIDLLWTDELRSLPHSTAGRKTLIVPAEAVEHFARAGLTFTTATLRSVNDLPPREVSKLRREQGPY